MMMLSVAKVVAASRGRLGQRAVSQWTGGLHHFMPPTPIDWERGSEREEVLGMLRNFRKQDPMMVPLVIGAEEVQTKDSQEIVCPLYPNRPLAYANIATARDIDTAMEKALYARSRWGALSCQDRINILMRASEQLLGTTRQIFNTSCIITYGQPPHASDLLGPVAVASALRATAQAAQALLTASPSAGAGPINFHTESCKGAGTIHYDPLDGFVFMSTSRYSPATTAALLATSLVAGNTVVWKPSIQGALIAYYLVGLFRSVGLPPGVLNVITGRAKPVVERVAAHPALAALVCTGSVATNRANYKLLAANSERYHAFPRFLAQGPANSFALVHASAPVADVLGTLLQGAFRDAGQHPAALRRAYIGEEMWREIQPHLTTALRAIPCGGPNQHEAVAGTVLDRATYSAAVSIIDRAAQAGVLVAGGKYSDAAGLFIAPTIIRCPLLHDRMLDTQIPLNAPILFVHVYDEVDLDAVIRHLTSPTAGGALAGAATILCNDRLALPYLTSTLRAAAGRLFINEAPTALATGDLYISPLGGSRSSGSNTPAGSPRLLLELTEPRVIVETFDPLPFDVEGSEDNAAAPEHSLPTEEEADDDNQEEEEEEEEEEEIADHRSSRRSASKSAEAPSALSRRRADSRRDDALAAAAASDSESDSEESLEDMLKKMDGVDVPNLMKELRAAAPRSPASGATSRGSSKFTVPRSK
jgi:1-pyrroline-5-carboxylate dehydrogenase